MIRCSARGRSPLLPGSTHSRIILHNQYLLLSDTWQNICRRPIPVKDPEITSDPRSQDEWDKDEARDRGPNQQMLHLRTHLQDELVSAPPRGQTRLLSAASPRHVILPQLWDFNAIWQRGGGGGLTFGPDGIIVCWEFSVLFSVLVFFSRGVKLPWHSNIIKGLEDRRCHEDRSGDASHKLLVLFFSYVW